MTWRSRTVDPFADWQPRSSGLYAPSRNRRDRPIAIDLFCGVGGFSLGFIQAGFEVVAGADYDVPAMVTYLSNLGSYPCNIVYIEPEDKERADAELRRSYHHAGWCDANGNWRGEGLTDRSGSGPLVSGKYRPADRPGVGTFFLGDIRKLTGERMLRELGLAPGEVDVVMGGPPCQGFSMAGKRDVMDPRNSLLFEFARLVLEIQPKTFCMENVPGLLSMVTPEGVPVLDAFCRVIEDGGFGKFETMKRALLASAGVGAVMKGRPVTRGAAPTDHDDEESAEVEQTSFLGAL